MENEQGGFYLMNINSWKLIIRRKIYKALIRQIVIDRVEKIVEQDTLKPDVTFERKSGKNIDKNPIAAVSDEE